MTDVPGTEPAPPGLPQPAGPPGPSFSRVARGAWYGLWAQAVDKLLPVALVLYLARSLAPELFGVYSFLLAYLAFFQVLSDYSIDTVLVRRLSASDADHPRVLRAGVTLKLAIGLASAAVAAALAPAISGGEVSAGLAFVAALTLPAGLSGAHRAYLRSTFEIRSLFLMNAGRALMLAAAVVTVVAAGGGIRGVFVAMAAANLATFAITAWILRERVPFGLVRDPETWRELMTGTLPLFVNVLAMTVSLRVGQVLLMSMRGPVEVGMLGAASRVSEAFSILPEALMITVYPLMAGLHGRRADALARTAERSLRYLVVCTGVPVVVCAVEPELVMTTLFGERFAAAGPLLGLLVFTSLLSATGTVILNLLLAVHRERPLYRNTVFFAALNLAASALLVRSHGAEGAAVALVATSAASQIALAVHPQTAAYVRPLAWPAARAGAAVVAAVAAATWSGWDALPATLLALGVYAVGLTVLGVVDRDEIRFVRAVVASTRATGA